MTKSDFAVFREQTRNLTTNQFSDFVNDMSSRFLGFKTEMEKRFQDFEVRMDKRFHDFEVRVDKRFQDFETRVEKRMDKHEQAIQLQIKDLEFRLLTRLGIMMVSTTTIAVALLTWLSKL